MWLSHGYLWLCHCFHCFMPTGRKATTETQPNHYQYSWTNSSTQSRDALMPGTLAYRAYTCIYIYMCVCSKWPLTQKKHILCIYIYIIVCSNMYIDSVHSYVYVYIWCVRTYIYIYTSNIYIYSVNIYI